MKIYRRFFPTGKRFYPFVLYSAIFIVFSSCGGTKPLRFGLDCECDCNQGNPIVVRIFQLKTTQKFLSATTDALLRNAEDALAGELVESTKIQERTLAPCEKKIFSDKKDDDPSYAYIEMSKEAQYVGIFADFRQPAADGWRKVFPVLLNRDKNNVKVKIIIKEHELDIEVRQ